MIFVVFDAVQVDNGSNPGISFKYGFRFKTVYHQVSQVDTDGKIKINQDRFYPFKRIIQGFDGDRSGFNPVSKQLLHALVNDLMPFADLLGLSVGSIIGEMESVGGGRQRQGQVDDV